MCVGGGGGGQGGRGEVGVGLDSASSVPQGERLGMGCKLAVFVCVYPTSVAWHKQLSVTRGVYCQVWRINTVSERGVRQSDGAGGGGGGGGKGGGGQRGEGEASFQRFSVVDEELSVYASA